MGSGNDNNHTDDSRPKTARRRFLRVAGLVVVFSGLVAVVYFLLPAQPRSAVQSEGDDSAPRLVEKGRLPIGHDRSQQDLDDPQRDGWDTEVLAQQAKDQLKKLAGLLRDTDNLDVAHAASFVTDDFRCAALLPTELSTAFHDSAVVVQRLVHADADKSRSTTFVGASGLVQALQPLAQVFQDVEDLRVAIKVFRISWTQDALTTRQYVAISGRTPKGVVEQHATWSVRWSTDPQDGPPKLTAITVEEFQQAVTQQSSPLFADCSQAVLAANPCYRGQFLVGMNHWLRRIKDVSYSSDPGLAVGDVDGDGLEDIYVCQEAGLPNRLFVQNPDGTASEVAADWTVDWLDSCRSALLIDLDNDGDSDLVVGTNGSLVVAVNDGSQFNIQATLPTSGYVMSLSASDYDVDGDLDLFACVIYSNTQLDGPRALVSGGLTDDVYHDAQNGGRNALFRNDGQGTHWDFKDVTLQVGLNEQNNRVSYAAAWEDYDDDGDPDLYIANDYARNQLFRNDRNSGESRFVDVAEQAGAQDQASGMSVSWGDYDRNGSMDLYVGNMFSAAGGRITFQDQFKSKAPQVKSLLQHFARGNTLLKNLGNGQFQDVSTAANVTMGRWSWGSKFCDLNNDGWEDLVVTNGYITTDDTRDL
ncbi:MAG: VCBS repeat-containing protein [Planctomycetaceae bacterium]